MDPKRTQDLMRTQDPMRTQEPMRTNLPWNEKRDGEEDFHIKKCLYGKPRFHVNVNQNIRKKNNVKPWNNSTVCDHFLHCDFLPLFGNFSTSAHKNKKYISKI